MNEILKQIVYYLGGIVNVFAIAFLLQCVTTVIKANSYSTKNMLISWCLFIPAGLASLFIQDNLESLLWIKGILFFMNIFLVSTFYYKTKCLKSILITSIVLIFSIVIDCIITLSIDMLHLNFQNLSSNKYSYFFIIVIVSLSLMFMGRLFQFFFFDKKRIEAKILAINSKYIIPPFLALIVCLLLSLATLAFNRYECSMYFILINVIQLVVVSFIGMYNLTTSLKHKESEQEFENTKLYNKSLLVINEQVKGIKHDMGNIVQAINGYLALKDYDGAIKYCNNVLNEFSSVNILSVLSPNIIDEPAIYGVIARKKYIAEEKGVEFNISVTASCKNIDFPLVELTRCIGILLDNALEATLETSDKKFWIEIRYDYKLKSHIIIVGNSIKDPSTIDTVRMFEHGYSTKEIPSGIGLYEIVKFMDKYNKGHIKPEINKKKNTFTQELSFKLEDNSPNVNNA